jgi:hypothetical protein
MMSKAGKCTDCQDKAYLITEKTNDITGFRFYDCQLGSEMQDLFMMGKVGMIIEEREVWFNQLFDE